MTKQVLLRRALVAILASAAASTSVPSSAFNFGDMMNPSRWMGGGRDRDYGYDDGPWGGPGYGYGYGPGYGVPGYGYGGYPGYYGYGAPGLYGAPPVATPTYSAPPSGATSEQSELEQLRKRVQELERMDVR
jgi:hypothetical protein